MVCLKFKLIYNLFQWFQVPKPKTHKTDNIIGFVTLEEFMLKKQEEERQQVYTDRVLMGVERKGGADEPRRRPDVDAGDGSVSAPLGNTFYITYNVKSYLIWKKYIKSTN